MHSNLRSAGLFFFQNKRFQAKWMQLLFSAKMKRENRLKL